MSEASNKDGPHPLRAGALSLCLLFGIGVSLAACVETGDFGRRRPGPFSALQPPDLAPQRALSESSLTADERELRQRAFALVRNARPVPLIAPFYLPDAFDRDIGPDPDLYYVALAGVPDQSPEARYRRLQSDVLADLDLIPKFRSVACRIAIADRGRLAAAKVAPALTDDERADAETRVMQNGAWGQAVEQALPRRADAYHVALERLVTASPDMMAKPTLQYLTALNALIDQEPCLMTPRKGLIRKG